jgi:serine/threonine-protein kinase
MEYIQSHVQQSPISLAERAPEKTFPTLLWPVIARALQKKPEDRFGSAADFAEAMQYVLKGATALPPHLLGDADATVRMQHLPPLETTSATPVVPRPPSAIPGSTPMPPQVVSKRASMGLLVGVGLAFLVVGAMLAVLVMKFVR